MSAHCPATFTTKKGEVLHCGAATSDVNHAPAPYYPHARHYAHWEERQAMVAWNEAEGREDAGPEVNGETQVRTR
jgi:hypothetical protein